MHRWDFQGLFAFKVSVHTISLVIDVASSWRSRIKSHMVDPLIEEKGQVAKIDRRSRLRVVDLPFL